MDKDTKKLHGSLLPFTLILLIAIVFIIALNYITQSHQINEDLVANTTKAKVDNNSINVIPKEWKPLPSKFNGVWESKPAIVYTIHEGSYEILLAGKFKFTGTMYCREKPDGSYKCVNFVSNKSRGFYDVSVGLYKISQDKLLICTAPSANIKDAVTFTKK